MMLVLGSQGQLGRAFVAQLGKQAIALSRHEVDLNDPAFTTRLPHKNIALVINAAAYTQVDKAEGEGRVEAYRVNAQAVEELAVWCKKHHLPLVHFSTDYVFDGSGAEPRGEEALCSPLNEYGKSKLAGEQAIQAVGGDYLIFRTSWVFDAVGKNFFTTIMRLLREKEQVRVVDDQIGAPTYALHLAQAVLDVLAQEERQVGLYHLCAGGHTSWYEFSRHIFALASAPNSGQTLPLTCREIIPIASRDYPLPAARPHNSRLDCGKAKKAFGVALPAWQEGLKECYEDYRRQNQRS